MVKRTVFLFLACVVLMSGCRERKPVSEMSDEEKVALEVSVNGHLTDEEKSRQKESRQAILDRAAQTKASEGELGRAMKNAEAVLDAAGFSALEEAQSLWLRQGRGADINRIVKSGVAPGDAFSQANRERADWIDVRVSWRMLIDMPGEYGGFYRSGDGRSLEIYEMGEQRLNAVVRSGADFVFTAEGMASAGAAELSCKNDRNASVRVVRQNADVIMIELGSAFSGSGMSGVGMLVEGRFERVKPGEWNVFSP